MPSRNKAGCGCSCSEETCVIHTDDFNRTDTTTIPSTTELVGNWTNTSNALYPEASVADQRIRFNDATLAWSSGTDHLTHYGVRNRVTIQGQAGDRVGAAIITDADGNSFAEATVTFGTGTAGRINLERFANGSSVWVWDAATECSVNEYDIAVDTPIQIDFCAVVVNAGELITWHFKVTIGDDVYRIGYAEFGATTSFSGITADPVGGLVTGTDAVAAFFDDFEFSQAGPEFEFSAPAVGGCEICPTCHLGFMQTGRVEEVAGDWTAETIKEWSTDDDNAILLFNANLAWANDNMRLTLRASLLNDGERRIIFSYVDTDNYWFLEFDVTALTGTPFYRVDWTLYHRSSGADTAIEDGSFTEVGALNIDVFIWDCTLILVPHGGVPGAGPWVFYHCIEGLSLNKTGRVGVGTGDIDGEVTFHEFWATCVEEFDCENLPGDSDPPDIDPGGEFQCCDDADGIAKDSVVELSISGLNPIVDCLGDPCAGDLVTFLTALNSTHTLTCIGANDSVAIFTLETGLDPPCETTPSPVTMRITLWIIHEGPDKCVAYVEFWAGSSCTFWLKSTTDKDDDESCDGFVFQKDDSHGTTAEDCCIDYSLVTGSLDFNV